MFLLLEKFRHIVVKKFLFFEQNLINSSEPVQESLSIFIRNTIQLNYKISDQFDIILKGRFNTSFIFFTIESNLLVANFNLSRKDGA